VADIVRKRFFEKQEKKDFTRILSTAVCKITDTLVFAEKLDYIL
jgi:hypothetical protein